MDVEEGLTVKWISIGWEEHIISRLFKCCLGRLLESMESYTSR